MTVIGSVNRTRPLGRRTRRHSRSTLRSYMWLIESMQIAASNEPASTGSVLRASTHTKRAGRRVRALRSPVGGRDAFVV